MRDEYERRGVDDRTLVRNMTRMDVLDSIIRESDNNCIWELRMSRNAFARLCELLIVRGGLTGDGRVTVEEQVAIFVNILAHHTKNRTIRVRFKRSGETISRYCHHVLHAVVRLHDVLLAKPEPVPQDCTDERWKWFKGCLGALDGTYIAVTPPATDRPRYRTRKGGLATNVLGVCTPEMNFIYVLSGWEGSASDSRVLRDAVTRPNGLNVPVGNYYLVDGGYTNGDGFLAPYRGRRYHIQEWGNSRRIAQNREELFNYRHARARNVIERCFGLLKKRWAILRSPSFYPIKTQCRIILACGLLHNFIRMNMKIDPLEFATITDDELPIGEEPINIISTVEPSNEWTQSRDNLAQQMWDEWRARN
ncbi:hypothetical protein Cni_G16630 [Canna indica]|uniref:DDE Tnp4 domain-containing protein n=1 Tax=Canna indica TaxID=4628 RepID=A0AAQ3QCQ7_9LILI|nr:hypothetical protein Cni_G16630 [Canna indica]